MKTLKKINFVVLPVAIWAAMLVDQFLILRLNLLHGGFSENVPQIVIDIIFILLMALQAAIVCVFSVLAVKRSDLTFKRSLLSLPIMYLLFFLYAPPSQYLFVYTAEWGFFFTKYPAMPSWKASLFITLQFGVIMLFTTLVADSKKREKPGEQ